MRPALGILLSAATVVAVPTLNYGGRGFHGNDPFAAAEASAAPAPEPRGRRQLQAGGTPDRCSTDESYNAWLALINSACCAHGGGCTNGLPTQCDVECANVLKPFQKSCKSKIRAGGLSDTIKTASRSCPSTGSSSRGCPKNIPSVSDRNAQQECGTGSGFWPVGSVCPVTCKGGGGHRRAQAGGSTYICAQGGWLSTSPISCGGGAPAVPLGPSRFVVGPDRVPQAQAQQYCRANYQTLASIHSGAEQAQAAAACAATHHAANDASDNNFGCWIGFEDRADEGGFIWSDGSNVDFVSFAPGEPNDAYGTTGEDAVAISFRGGQRLGRWNDETHSPDTSGFSWGMNYPLCQTEVPPSDHTKTRVWGAGQSHSLNLRICVDADDYLYFQDDRLWLQYGGNWGAAGGGGCPEDYQGKAYVSEQVWDISGLQACQPGSTCPVSKTFTDTRFMVPSGCGSVQTQVTQNSVRGQIDVQEPTAGNGWRGELHMSDPYGGADVFDFTITLNCIGSSPHHKERLSCVHNAGGDGQPCNMGRMEVWNPNVERPGAPQSGAWGSVCGQWLWNNNNGAKIFCRNLGFADGEIYTFGRTNYLPELPIVEGWKVCDGSERDLLNCPMSDAITVDHRYDPPSDLDCATSGCVGADGLAGTADDSIDTGLACNHEVDQGAICYEDQEPMDLVMVPKCGNGGTVKWFWNARFDDENTQDIAFGCIDYFTTQCSFDATNNAVNERALYQHGAEGNVGTYMHAMRAFARCSEVRPAAPGYCHGSLASAAQLANHEVCAGQSLTQTVCTMQGTDCHQVTGAEGQGGGATTNIGFHIRMPFYILSPGDYSFRMHADYGAGSFMGVDGAEYTPGDIWGHVNIDAAALTAGNHEFDVLGFEPCCDGHAEMEIHLPCDDSDSPWRTVVSGESECLQCDGTLDASCSMDTESAGCCGNSGGHTLCHPKLEDGTCGADGFGVANEDATTIIGRFIAIGEAMDQPAAVAYCAQHYAGIASIHSSAEQAQAATACRQYADPSGDEGTTMGCWIGLNDEETQGGFVWNDGSAVDFVDWGPGEPNGFNGATLEDQVMLMFFTPFTRNGDWNDADGQPDACERGQAANKDLDCRFGQHGLFPLCQVTGPPAPAPAAPRVWGTGATSSFRVQVCVDRIDTLFFQDDRLWLSYGGQWSAPGASPDCPDRYKGKAYVNSQEWDISGMAGCQQGVQCPVSSTFTDAQFMVPQGCASIQMMATKNAGRGEVTSFPPSRQSSYRGELEISDEGPGRGGPEVYDITVTLTCSNIAPTQDISAGSTGVHNARLSCIHQSQITDTSATVSAGQLIANQATSCRMGRVEVFNPSARHANGVGTGTWGTVCGHYFWDNTEMANVVCRQLGFASGFIYTFGATRLLPTLPIVAGFRTCSGVESNIFQCEAGGNPQDRDCWIGCRGADGQSGTADDTMDPTCTHTVDQGVICEVADSPQRRNAGLTDPCHHNTAGRGALYDANHQQPIIFACIEYYSTQCVYDIGSARLVNGIGSYTHAMHAFAECAEVIPEPCGYCHDALDSARYLANHDVCAGCEGPATFGQPGDTESGYGTDAFTGGGSTTDIGFHIRIPFRTTMQGMYTFRYHQDMGLGSFMGVDGPEFRPGNTWGHVETAGTVITVGEHEWEVLGFEDCCDGHAELEVHLPCDNADSPWRLVAHGESPCLSCSLVDPMTEGPVIDGVQRSCASENEAAACCRQEGHGCNNLGSGISGACSVGADIVCTACDDPNALPTSARVGRFVAVGRTMSIFNALDYCEEHYQGLASIHSWEEAQQARSACLAYADGTETVTSAGGNHLYGCWIGFQDTGAEGGFVWLDGSSVSFVDWAPGEPNDVGTGEDAVEIDFRERLTRKGEWNDATQAEDYEMFPLCETSIPAPVPGEAMNWGTQTTASFRVRVCIDHIDDIYFQDDRMWIQYGGQYSAAGTHGSCPERYRNRAYINNDLWDIHAMGDCVAGSYCAVSPTFTDEQFEVPMGCNSVTTTATTMRGRGIVTTEDPNPGNGWRGGVHIEDRDGGAAVYDIRVQLTCNGRESSAPQVPVRLSCTHTYGSSSCHMGRIEVWAPQARHLNSNQIGTWGTVCGHWFWEGDTLAEVVCKQLGYSSGATYTFGHTPQLPHLPVVAGFRTCTGSESNIFGCPMTGDPTKTVCTGCVGATSPDAPGPGQPVDMDCLNGCVGPDKIQGTADDSVDPTCPHSLDQGAICHNEGQSQVALPHCRGCGVGCAMTECVRNTAGEFSGQCNYEQPAVFGCIDYYSTECTFDVTGTDLAAGVGSYMTAMRAFATCAEQYEEAPGYCHGALLDAKVLSNQQVCTGGVTTNIGFHIRIPFKVNMVGTYTFRMHADYGLGGYVGVDGASFTDATWGHVELDPVSLTSGEHDFESLGFEDCCDGHSELEVHLPCDGNSAPWRYVIAGTSDCLACGAVLDASCSYSDPDEGR